ncbi:Nucleotidyltransferase domain-containing protein [Candidatus Magnetomoraceae bacterium gMMP-1]
MTNWKNKQYIELILKKLKKINPYKVILFGSYAYGKPKPDSDIDLIVVLNNEDIPANFKEKNKNYLTVSKSIRNISKLIPVDLIVYTQNEFNRFVELESNFSKYVLSNGKELL